jgi:periplasmic divalent cation tolerance protein
MKSRNYSIILSTLKSEEDAEILARKILEKKLAFCIQIQKIKSFYPWNNKIERVDEYLLLIKTRTDLFQELSEYVKLNHGYKTPE